MGYVAGCWVAGEYCKDWLPAWPPKPRVWDFTTPEVVKALPHYTFDPGSNRDRIQLRRVHTALERMRIEPIRIGSR